MPDAPQPDTHYDTTLGTLEYVFKNNAKGLVPSDNINQLKFVTHHFAKHMQTTKTHQLSFLDKLRAVTKGSRGYLDDEGNRPKELGKPDAGWYLVYASHVALGLDALGAHGDDTPGYEGGTWFFGYRHRGPNGRIVEDTVLCTFEGNQREWMRFESAGMTSLFHFARGKTVPTDCWMECDGFFTCPAGNRRNASIAEGQPRGIARFNPNSKEPPGSYDIAVFDNEIPHHLVWCYDSNGKVTNGKLFDKGGDDDNVVFFPGGMMSLDVYNICHDSTSYKTDVADGTMFFDSYEPTCNTEKSMARFLEAKTKADKQLLEEAFSHWSGLSRHAAYAPGGTGAKRARRSFDTQAAGL